ncbi:hypothetical protein H632_c3344p0 [Helicosporidium sp. ATCC 50920]|nr:hypothetical protein H632_c3344p0 [Helicosporidium sp. ATCC 50920]|eukprot:KDD72439.1 hypothetical protein H632_c3344p0 [Helicosporidium sp. ATCC 50920]
MVPLYPGHVPQPPPAIPSSPAPSGRTGSLPPAHSTFVPGTKQTDPNAALHEAMTDELADMAAALKNSTLAVENQVRLRGDILNSTEDKLDKSVAGVGFAKRRTGEIHAAYVSCGESGDSVSL